MGYPTIDGITATSIPYFVDQEGHGYVVLGQRKKTSEAFPGAWCLVGGFLNPKVESLEDTAIRELQEETGFVVSFSSLELVTVQSSPKRDPRGHVIDTVWKVLFEEMVPPVASDDLEDARWFPLEQALDMNLAFDHDESLYIFAAKEGLL